MTPPPQVLNRFCLTSFRLESKMVAHVSPDGAGVMSWLGDVARLTAAAPQEGPKATPLIRGSLFGSVSNFSSRGRDRPSDAIDWIRGRAIESPYNPSNV
jgi:hypothetical protein